MRSHTHTHSAVHDGPDRHHLQQFSRALKILLLPQAFVPRRRLALQIAAPAPMEPICWERRRIPLAHFHLTPPLPLLTPLIPPPVNNWLMADEMSQIAAEGALTCYKGSTADAGSPPPSAPNRRHDTLFRRRNAISYLVTLIAERRRRKRRRGGSLIK